MPDTFTGNYSLTKVGIGESRHTWGVKGNVNLDIIDVQLKANADAAAAANANANTRLTLTGGVLTGPLRAPNISIDTTFSMQLNGAVPTVLFDATDGITYDRQNDTFSLVTANTTRLAVGNAAATCNVPLVLAHAPSAANHATRKDYVDAQVATRMPITGGQFTGDVTTFRPNTPAQGYVFFGNSGGRWLGWDGANYVTALGALWHTGNFNPGAYLPTGGGTITGNLQTNGQTHTHGRAHFYDGYVQIRQADGGAWRWVHNNSGNIGFLNSGAGWSFRVDDGGNCIASGNVTAYSDRTLKTDFRAVDDPDEIVRKLARAVSRFRWKEGEQRDHTSEQVGVIAQDVRDALPEAVRETSDGILTVSDRPMLAVLIATVARLLDRVEELEADVI